jgi:hypothetical protein
MKLKVIQFYYSDNLEYLKQSEVINSEYCKKYDIEYYCEKDKVKIFDTLIDRAGSWYKIPFLKEQLESSDCDYVAYIDSDAFIVTEEVDFRDIIALHPDHDLIIGEDFGPDLINGGVLIFKNTDWSKDFLQRVWNKSEILSRGKYKREIWLEQTVLSTFLLINDADAAKAKILPWNIKNSINCLQLTKNTFIYHDLSKTRITDFYKLKTGTGDAQSHINLTTSSDRQVSHKYFDYYIPLIQQKNADGIKVNVLDVGGDEGIAFGCLLENTSLDFNYICLTNKVIDNKTIQTVQYDALSEEHIDKFIAENNFKFDIIIDDNTHRSEERNFLFLKLFPLLKNGGTYIVEDLQTDTEISNPQKNAQYGWGDPEKKSITDLIYQFNIDGSFSSDYYDFENINESITKAEVFKVLHGSYLGLIYKK